MSLNDDFKWYGFYEVGCELLEKDGAKYWRSAIGCFYYAAFCEARDFLISNNIYHNHDLDIKLKSDTGVVHQATQDIFKYADELNCHDLGWNVSDKLKELKNYRSFADYYCEARNFKFYAKRSKVNASFVFSKLDEF